jgi:hypothetical protein
MLDMMLDVIIRIALIVATGFLFSVVLLAYLRLKNTKMGLISIGFGIFFVNAIIHFPELIIESFDLMFSENMYLLIHLIGLVFIAAGLLKD